MIAIIRRYDFEGRTYRVLDCGQEHAVTEPRGGKAGYATHVKGCQICNLAKVRPAPVAPIGTCGAVVLPMKERSARPCGRPARALKNGEPRCGFHMKRGAA